MREDRGLGVVANLHSRARKGAGLGPQSPPVLGAVLLRACDRFFWARGDTRGPAISSVVSSYIQMTNDKNDGLRWTLLPPALSRRGTGRPLALSGATHRSHTRRCAPLRGQASLRAIDEGDPATSLRSGCRAEPWLLRSGCGRHPASGIRHPPPALFPAYVQLWRERARNFL
jgi:hypothetical protein